ncbi:hypothetical protein Bca52824_016180 [Brassica carinata]|uniref:Uncharacterized protein n=1 Tax=Brassica carinata TaxID=52824 RepID=A0A8X7W4L9_BRACI|nr:hypothetical protein Bca52824_016180 [Brassica carinata]
MRKVMWRILWSSLSKENEDHSGCTSKTLPWDSVKTCSKQTMEPHNGDQIYQNRLDAPSIYFSGHKQGPSAYLKWEDDTEKWFIAWRIPEKLKPTYAVDTLTGEAYKWWSQLDADRIYFNDPAYTLKEVKIVMYTEFVKRAQHTQKVSTKRTVRPQVLQPSAQREAVFQRQTSRPVHKPQVKRTQALPEAKETNLEVSDPLTSLDDSFTRIDKKFDNLINLIKGGSSSVSSNSMTVLAHSSSAQKVENISGLGKEEKRPEAHQHEKYEQSTLETSTPADRGHSKKDIFVTMRSLTVKPLSIDSQLN